MATIHTRLDRPSPYTVRWREAGRQRSRSFRTEREAKRWRNKAEQAELDGRTTGGRNPDVARRTVAEHAPHWLASKSHITERAQATHRSALNVWIIPAIGDKRLRAITPDDLEGILAECSKAGKPWARLYAYRALCGLLDHALGPDAHRCREVVAGTPKRKRKPQPFTRPELDRLLAKLEGEHATYAEVLGVMGLRPIEGANLTVGSIDRRRWTLAVDTAKGGTPRVLTIPQRLRTPLKALCHRRAPDAPLWSVSLDPDNWRKRVFHPAVKAAKIKGNRVPYDLRHTCASTLISRGATPTDVADWMGHSVRMTLEVYSHLFPGRKKELARILNKG